MQKIKALSQEIRKISALQTDQPTYQPIKRRTWGLIGKFHFQKLFWPTSSSIIIPMPCLESEVLGDHWSTQDNNSVSFGLLAGQTGGAQRNIENPGEVHPFCCLGTHFLSNFSEKKCFVGYLNNIIWKQTLVTNIHNKEHSYLAAIQPIMRKVPFWLKHSDNSFKDSASIQVLNGSFSFPRSWHQ